MGASEVQAREAGSKTMRTLCVLLLLAALRGTDGFGTRLPTFQQKITRSQSCFEPSTARGARAFGSPFHRSLRAQGGPAAPTPIKPDHGLVELLEDCKGWGLARFISVNPAGSVLETSARMDLSMNGFNVPGKGQYLTIATEDKLFECHINLAKVESVAFSQDAAKVGGHTLHVMRIKGPDGLMLSIMLQYDVTRGPGEYFEGSVEAFERTMSKYGPETSFA
uniref:Uncharacterized protein n=1 Tax=Hemiselmis tepida TaxID=464990 RepID=A0A7S0VV11_9CRYP|mmetsp:Transcript_28834/g.73078  ORF Transcript_28834/g.73078 Transcript_28834/m.73078 type:complete len:222 (+) Transcript_28834:1-666(+)